MHNDCGENCDRSAVAKQVCKGRRKTAITLNDSNLTQPVIHRRTMSVTKPS